MTRVLLEDKNAVIYAVENVGNVAAFAVSNLARNMTVTAITITCGRVAD